jgi:hypothetical protein
MPSVPQVTWNKSDFEDPKLGLFNLHWQNLVQAINLLSGRGTGPAVIASDLDVSTKRIKNVGNPVAATDAISKAYADANYGPAALRPQMEQLGKSVMQSVRRLNDNAQRESYSSFLNNLMSTAPTTNTSNVTFGAPGGGTVPVTISSGFFLRVDGTQVPYPAFNDTVSLPTTFNISTLARLGGVVTATTTAANPFNAGDTINIINANALSDQSFVGAFVITTIVSPTVFKYAQSAPDTNATGGQVSSGSVFYYHLNLGQKTLQRSSASVDTWQNRLNSSTDGQTLVAVAVVHGAGGIVSQSAAGATSPAATGGVRIFGRL